MASPGSCPSCSPDGPQPGRPRLPQLAGSPALQRTGFYSVSCRLPGSVSLPRRESGIFRNLKEGWTQASHLQRKRCSDVQRPEGVCPSSPMVIQGTRPHRAALAAPQPPLTTECRWRWPATPTSGPVRTPRPQGGPRRRLLQRGVRPSDFAVAGVTKPRNRANGCQHPGPKRGCRLIFQGTRPSPHRCSKPRTRW